MWVLIFVLLCIIGFLFWGEILINAKVTSIEKRLHNNGLL